MFNVASYINKPVTVDYRMWAGDRLDQLSASACTAGAMVNACELIALRLGIKVDLSMHYNYYGSRALGNITGDNGSTVLLALKAAMSGIATETTSPFIPAKINDAPSAAAVASANDFKVLSYEQIYFNSESGNQRVEALKGALAQGYIPLLQTEVNRQFVFEHRPLGDQGWVNQSVTNPMGIVGRHAVDVVGYGMPGKYGVPVGPIVENSWNTTWGDNGFGVIPPTSYTDKAFIITAVEIKGVTYDFTYSQDRVDVAELYAALFNRVPEKTGLNYWDQKLDTMSVADVAGIMFNSAPAREYYPTGSSHSATVSQFYANVLDRQVDLTGLQYWTGKLDSGASVGSVVVNMIDAVLNYQGTDTVALQSQALFENKINVGMYYSVQMAADEVIPHSFDGLTYDPNTVEVVKIGLYNEVYA